MDKLEIDLSYVSGQDAEMATAILSGAAASLALIPNIPITFHEEDGVSTLWSRGSTKRNRESGDEQS